MSSWTSSPNGRRGFLYPNALAHDSGSLSVPVEGAPGADSDEGRAEALQRPGLTSITLWRRADPSIQTTCLHWHGRHCNRQTSAPAACRYRWRRARRVRSEEHTSELQSRFDLVCRLLLEKKK